MTSAVEALELEEKKSEDKKEIADEEREKMLNEENKTLSNEPTEEQKIKEPLLEGEEVIAVQEEKKQEGEVEKMKKVLEETEKEKEKQGIRKKIPIGGIKMPGFLRSRSKEKANKDVEVGDVEEGADLLAPETPCVSLTAGGEEPAATGATEKKEKPKRSLPSLPSLPALPSIKLSNPFAKKPKEVPAVPLEQTTEPAEDVEAGEKGDSEKEKEDEAEKEGEKEGEKEKEKEKEKETKSSGSKRILDAIRLPLVSVFPRKLKPKDKTAQEPGAAGLASMETLDDSGDSKEKGSNAGDDGMESVKLDPSESEKVDVEKGAAPPPNEEQKATWKERVLAIERWKLIVGGVALFLILLVIIILIAVFGPRRGFQAAPLVDGRYVNAVTFCGPVQGVLEDGAYAFRGVPYARPPIGEHRWKRAQSLDNLNYCWNGTLLAHNSTSSCWQKNHDGSMDGSEDCLTMEIFTPEVRYFNPVPVVVLIGAESFNGDSPGILRASTKLAHTKEVVFVRPNFRLNALGFLAAEALTNSTHPPTSGNYALSDIITALHWINMNIRHFGGDQNSVTLLGHRAGATLVTVLTSSKQATKYFTRAWVSSGSAILPGKSLSEYEALNANYVTSLECNSTELNKADCLRSVDAEELLNAVPTSWSRQEQDLPKADENTQERHEWLVKDGDIIKEHPVEVWASEGLPVKLVIGTTAHVDASPKLRTLYPNEDLIAKHIRGGQLAKLGLDEEAIRRYGSTWPGLASMISDIRTVCPLLTVATAQSSVPFYVVNQTRDIGMGGLADVGADVAAILNRYVAKSVEERRFVTAMQRLFYHFVWHGKLMTDGIDHSSGYNRVLVVGQDVIPLQNYPNCNYWIQKDVVPRYARID